MKKKSILISILAILVLVFSITNSFAALDIDGPNNNTNNTNDPDEPDVPGLVVIDDNNVRNSNTNTNSINDRGNENSTKNNNMPDTGIEDAPIIAVGICIVVATVAYIQIKRYNNV